MGGLNHWKFNCVSKSIVKKLLILSINKKLKGYNKVIFNKSDIIVKSLINKNMLLYKGCYYRKFYISKFVLGFRFGEFAYTRKPFKYILKKK